MSTTLNDTMDTAKHAVDSAMESTGHAASSARSTLLDGVKMVTGIVAMLRDLGVNDALGWVGLSRRRSPLRSVAVFSAGVALGAGVGVLFAPMSGGDLRRAILGRLMGPSHRAKDAMQNAAHDVSEGTATAHASPGNGHRPA